MSEEIINVLNYLGEQIGIAIDWTSQNVMPQVMDILGRYRLFEIAKISFELITGFVFIIIGIILIRKIIKGYS